MAVLLVVWLACAAIAALFGRWKGRPVTGLLIGLCLPVVGVLVMAAVSARPARSRPGFGRPGSLGRCPWCQERIPFDVRICNHCFQRVEP